MAELNTELKAEYKVRQQMLLTRLDVTVQSFRWSERAKANLDEIEKIFQPKRAALQATSSVEPTDVFLATTGA